MKKIAIIIIIMFLSGCAGERYSGSAIDMTPSIKKSKVIVVDNKNTKVSFRGAVESWLKKNGYDYEVIPDGSKYNLDQITLEYEGKWRWDMAIYLHSASIKAFHKGQLVGESEYRSAGNFNMKKFGSAEERVNNMMNNVFGKPTSPQINREK